MKKMRFILIPAACLFLACLAVIVYTVRGGYTTAIGGGRELLIVMYHSVIADSSRAGKYVVTPDTVKEDIMYLKNNGYSFVSAQEVIDYSEHGTPLPKKPVMLTFDDGNYNFYSHVMPILEETGAKAVCSIVGSYTDEFSESNIKNATYGYLRWSEVYDMYLSNRVEVGNHSYDFHSVDKGRNGAQKKKGESDEEYKRVFCADTEKAQNRFLSKTGFAPIIYAYPFGAYSKGTTEWLQDMGFKMSFSCTEGINTVTSDPDSLFMLKRFNRPSGLSSADFFERCGL